MIDDSAVRSEPQECQRSYKFGSRQIVHGIYELTSSVVNNCRRSASHAGDGQPQIRLRDECEPEKANEYGQSDDPEEETLGGGNSGD